MGRRSLLLLLLLLPAIVSGQNPTGPRVDIVPSGTGSGQTGELRFYELLANGTNYAGFKSADNLSANLIWRLPTADGSSGQVLQTDGAGNLSFGAGGGGGSGCVPTGAAGEVLFSDGAGACSDDSTFSWDNTNKDLQISGSGVVAEFDVTTDFNAFGSNARVVATAYSGSSVSFGGMYLGRTARGTAASPTATQSGDVLLNNQAYAHDGTGFAFGGGYNFYAGSTWSGSNHHTVMSFVTIGSGSTTPTSSVWIGRETVGSISLLNDQGIWFNDSGATPRRTLHLDGSNNLNVGVNVSSFGSGGDLVFFASNAGSPAVVEFTSTSSLAGTFAPKLGHAIGLGGTGSLQEPWSGGNFVGTLTIYDPGAGSAQLAIEDVGNTGAFINITRASGGSTYGWVIPNANASGVLTNDGAGNLSWGAGGGGGFTCNTANNCTDITGTQTITGAKTFSTNNVKLQNVGLQLADSGGTVFHTLKAGSTSNRTQLLNSSGALAQEWNSATGQTLIGTSGFPMNLIVYGQITPAVGSTYNLGASGVRWVNLYLSGALDAQAGLATGSSSNSTLYVGSSGNFYNRTLAGASTGVSCAGVANGWTAIATDNYIVTCRGSARYRAQLVAF